MYRHLVNEIYHTVVYTLLPLTMYRTDFVYIENPKILYTTSCT